MAHRHEFFNSLYTILATLLVKRDFSKNLLELEKKKNERVEIQVKKKKMRKKLIKFKKAVQHKKAKINADEFSKRERTNRKKKTKKRKQSMFIMFINIENEKLSMLEHKGFSSFKE